jgi:hypothetical protein
MHTAHCTLPDDRRGRSRATVVLRVLLAVCVLQVALIAGACAKAQAKAAPDGPPLAVPAPPPRVLLPVEEPPVAEETPPAPEESAPPPPRPRPAATPPRRATSTPQSPPVEESKPETPAAQAPPVSEPAAPRPVTPADAAAEKRVRDVMTKAATDLGRIYYQRLSADGKAQYDLSKRFNEQADQALKDRNYAYAATLADKAAALASELLGSR